MRKTLHIVLTSLILLWLSGVSGVLAQSGTERPFITKWQGEAGKELVLPIFGTEYKLVIKNAKDEVVKSEEKITREDLKSPYTFTPDADGVYTVEAGPEGVKYMRTFDDKEDIIIGDSEKLLAVVQFGTVGWESMECMFAGADRMSFAADIDTPDLSKVTSMVGMFVECCAFNQPLNNWKVDNVTNMEYMFAKCFAFNQPLNEWNVSNVTNMKYMFGDCFAFNQPLNEWNVSKVTDMEGMFNDCSFFNQPLNNWDVSKVTNMNYMFYDCSAFNQPLNNWDVSNVTDMFDMFFGCSSFNQPLDNWNVGNVTRMCKMFHGCSSFNQPLNNWNVSKVWNMSGMFFGCSSFNQPLDKWNVSKVTKMDLMFFGCSSFNQPLNNWNVSKVTDMSCMFKGCAAFNQPLDKWNVSKVIHILEMFHGCSSFNQPLNNWNVSKVWNMLGMFSGCSSFNQPLNNWNVSKVTKMDGMFSDCSSFNQPLGSWKIKTAVGKLSETAMSPSNYSATLAGWAAQNEIAKDVDFSDDEHSVSGLIYNNQGKAARKKLIDKGWKFDGDSYQLRGVAITPHSLPLVLNKEFTLPLEKWGVEETEEVTLSTDTEGIISYELTEDKKGVHIKGLKEGTCKLTATIAAKAGGHAAYTSTCEIKVYIP